MISEKHAGELSAYGGAILWSLFPVITVLTVSDLPPLFTAAIATGIAALFFFVVLLAKKRMSFRHSRTIWKNMLLSMLLGIYLLTRT